MSGRPGPVPGDGLLHPLALLAMLTLGVNDHWGKAAFPGLVTGKLSDLAGLLFFPLLLQAAWEKAGGAIRPRVLAGTCIATAIVFAAVKVWPPAHAAYEHGLGALQWPFLATWALVRGVSIPSLPTVGLVADPTDLVALPMVAAAWWIGRGRRRDRAA